jgi:hypothetical protein
MTANAPTTAAASATRAAPARAGAPAELSEHARSELAERLQPLAQDRVLAASAVALACSRAILESELARAALPAAARLCALEGALAPVIDAHGWRGSVATWIDALRRAARAPVSDAWAALAEELGLWLSGIAGDESGRVLADERGDWSGEALAPGARVADRRRLAEHAARELARGEEILVHGYSETVALAVEAAQRAGRAPSVLLTEGAADGGGRRMALALAASGARLRLCEDVAAFASVEACDRVWIGAEALGAGAFVARAGSALLLELARDRGVPAELLAASDELVPGGELALPQWCGREDWILWPDAPEGVELETQLYEIVPFELCERIVTEAGRESAAALCLRRLRTERAAPLAGLDLEG